MAETDVYNFQAPQFIESLSEVKLDDGADTFFDAEEAAGIEPKNEEEIVPEKGIEPTKKLTENEEAKNSSTTKYHKKKESNNGKLSKVNNENLDPESGNSGPLTRLQRMSLKPNGLKNQSKFSSVAEQIHKFHHSTPPRFKRKSAIFKSKSCKFLPTIAHSPQLRTKIRAARPSTAPIATIPDKKSVIVQVKKKEFVAIKPIPKPPTVPVPFNLTIPGSKKLEEKMEDKTANIKETSVNKEKKQNFSAPKTLLRKPLPIKKKRLEIQDNKLTVKESWGVTGIKTIERPNSTTKTVPFSFEKRNQEKLLEKQRKLEEAKEQQNKAVSVANTPRKVLRSSTVSVPGSAKQPIKVKNEETPAGKISRKSVK